MDILVKKIELIEWLVKLEDKQILDQINLLKEKFSNSKPISPEEYKRILDQTDADFKDGKITPHEDLIKEAKNW